VDNRLSNIKPYDLLVFFAMALSGIVFYEPAPYDIVMIILIGFFIPRKTRIFFNDNSKHILVLLTGFILMNIISLINANDFIYGLRYGLITIYLILTSVWLKTYLDSVYKTRIIIYGYIIAGSIAVIIGFLPSFGVNWPWNIIVDDGWRIRGTFKDPNVFGPFFIPLIIIMLDEIRKPTLFLKEIFVPKITVVVSMVGLIFSFSRGAWLGSVLAFLTYLTLNYKQFNTKVVLEFTKVAIISAIIISTLLTHTGRWDYFYSRLGLQGYDYDRFATQRAALSEKKANLEVTNVDNLSHENLSVTNISEEPIDIKEDKKKKYFTKIIGFGPGQFELNYPMSAHSLFVRTISENGVIGFSLLTIIFGILIIKLYQRRISGISIFGLNINAILAIIIGILVNGLVIDTIHWRHLWLILGIAWIGISNERDLNSNKGEKT